MNILKFISDEIVPKIVTGIVLVYPIVVAACKYFTTGVSNGNGNIPRQTIAIVSPSEQHANVTQRLPLRFQKEGLLVTFEDGFLGTRINPILMRGRVFVLSQGNFGHSMPENHLLGETVSQSEQGESSLVGSDFSDSGDSASQTDQLESTSLLSEESLDLSDFSDESINVSAITPESFDMVILRKKNLLTQCLEEAQKLNSRVYGILTLFSEIWVDVYQTHIPEVPDFASYNNPAYKPTEITTPVYYELRSGTRHFFRKIRQFEGLQTRLEESSGQRDRLQEDVETDIKIFCQLLSDVREEYSYEYITSEAQETIETYFQELSIEIERKRFAQALQESNTQYLTSQAEQFERDLRSIISTARELKGEMIWAIEHSLLHNSQVIVERYQLSIAQLRQEIALMEELQQRDMSNFVISQNDAYETDDPGNDAADDHQSDD